MAKLKMGKDGFPLVTEEAIESPWWLPLLGIFVIAVALGWVALSLKANASEPRTVKVKVIPPDAADAPAPDTPE